MLAFVNVWVAYDALYFEHDIAEEKYTRVESFVRVEVVLANMRVYREALLM